MSGFAQAGNATAFRGVPLKVGAPADGQVYRFVLASGDFELGTGGVSPTDVDALDTLANRGLYGGNGTVAGFLFLTSDTGQIYRASGAGWVAFTPAASDPTKLAIAANLSDVASRQTALNNLAGAVTSGDVLQGDGANIVLAPFSPASLPPIIGILARTFQK